MPNKDTRAPIAVRTAMLRLPGGKRIAVRFAIKALVRRRSEGDHLCRFTITGIGEDSERSILGCDAVQAIELAIRYAGYTIEHWLPAGAVWEDAPENMGLPRREAVSGPGPERAERSPRSAGRDAPPRGGESGQRGVLGSADVHGAHPRKARPRKGQRSHL